MDCSAGILVDLLTLEVQSYGEESMAGSKVVEHIATAPSVACSSMPVTADGAGSSGAVTGPPLRPPQPATSSAAAMGPPAGPQPPHPPVTVLTPNTFIQPSKHLL